LTPLERMFRRHDQPVRRPGLRTDVVHLLLTSALATAASVVPVVVGFVLTRPLPRLDVVVAKWPLAVQAMWAVFWIELAVYWAHRLLHRVPLFWRFHKIHHSSTRLDWIAGARVHPFDRAIGVALAVVPAFVLGVRPVQFGAFAAIQGVLAVLLHANVRWRLRPLGRVVSTTEFHHWHHSLGDDARDANFAAFASDGAERQGPSGLRRSGTLRPERPPTERKGSVPVVEPREHPPSSAPVDRGLDSIADLKAFTRLLFFGIAGVLIIGTVVMLLTRNWSMLLILIGAYAVIAVIQWIAVRHRLAGKRDPR
jgi:hypothetical protein